MKFIALVFLLSLTIGLTAQENMTLEKAISIGLENNFGIKIAEQSIAISQNNNTWARAGKGPIVDLNGFFSNSTTNDNNPASFLRGTYNNSSIGASLDAQWIVLDGGRIKIRKEQFESTVVQQELQKNLVAHDLIRSIIQAYYEVLFQEERLEILRDNIRLSKGRIQFENTKREFGVSNSFNLIQFENAILSDSINIVSQKSQLDIAKRTLSNILNESAYVDYQFVDKLSVAIEEIDELKLRSSLEEENYTLKTLMLLSELDQLNTRLRKANLKPTLSLSGSLGFSESGFKFFEENPNTGETYPLQFSNRINLGLNANFNWNLYDGGLRNQDIQSAVLQEELTKLNILEAQIALNNQLNILISNFKNQNLLLTLIGEQIQLANKNLLMTEERFKAGQINSLDFQTVQNQLLTAQFNKINAIYNLLITKSEIDWLVGSFKQ